MATRIFSSKLSEIPRVPGRPLIGNTLEFLSRPLGFLIDAYHNYGPVFRMEVPMTRAVVVAGSLAEEFLRSAPDLEMSRDGLFRPFSTEVGVDVFELAGEMHRRMRALLRLPYSRQLIAQFTPEITEVVADAVDDWHSGQTIDLFAVTARLALHASMATVTPISLRSCADDISAAGNRVMYAAFRLMPYAALAAPSYRRSRRHMQEFIDEAIARHRQGEFASLPKTYMIDACLSASNSADERMDLRDIRAACFYALAGTEIYIGRLIGFIVYELLRNRHYLGRVLAEIDEMRPPDGKETDFRRMPALRAVYVEALRCYPLIPAFPYTARDDMALGGFTIPKGQLVLFAPHIAHFRDEHYKNPMAFDPERHLTQGRDASRTATFSSFGVGSHTCSAQGLVETIALTIVCSLLRRRELELIRPSYRMRLRMTPLLAPHKTIAVRVKGDRTPQQPPPKEEL